MSTHNKGHSGHSNISIIDAVETLSHIADLEFDQNIGVTEEHNFLFQDQKITYRTVHWLHKKDGEITVEIVKNIFRVVLDYLKKFYQKEYAYVTDPDTLEGIKTIMVLVGEAAKKLDKYTDLFHLSHAKSVMELKEYKHLQDFYYSRIARKIDEGVLSKWIYALSNHMVPKKPKVSLISRKSMQTKHIFVDLEAVKKDTEYELFFLKKEDGTRFFSPRIIRNIKLVCDFGNYFGAERGDDPLVDIRMWQDSCLHRSAKNLLDSAGTEMNVFFHEAAHHKDHELVSILYKACMALILSANPKNLIRNMPIKNCTSYFKDFEGFMRKAMYSTEYQKLNAYPPNQSDKLGMVLLNTVHAILREFFISMRGYQEVAVAFEHLIQEAILDVSVEHVHAANHSHSIWSKLAAEYMAVVKLLKHHPNGPLINVLNTLQDGDYHVFDPLMQNNTPNPIYHLNYDDHTILDIRIPAPLFQESIHKAHLAEEFRGFLRSLKDNTAITKFLYFNLQDRNSWREYARCQLLEDLQKNQELKKHLVVVTLPKDTEFYHQVSPYHEENHADIFINTFKDQILDESGGFYFPPEIKSILSTEFLDPLFNAVKHIFFSNRNVLLREHRLVFIELIYLFLELKILEMVKPDAFSLACKDGIDIGCTGNAQLMIFLKLINQEPFSEDDIKILHSILFIPSTMIRERAIMPERFNRMISLIKSVESFKEELGAQFDQVVHDAFDSLYETSILHSKIAP